MNSAEDRCKLTKYVTVVVSKYVEGNQIPWSDISGLIRSVYEALVGIDVQENVAGMSGNSIPAVPVSRSVTDDYITCLEDGAKLKMLKRYLRTHFNLTPDEYRAKWNLPASYPMVARSYAQSRSEVAKRIGLGREAPYSGRGRKKEPPQ